MPVKIEMKMPGSCTNCRYCDRGSEIGRLYCSLTRHDFPSSDGCISRFTTCPLKECVYMEEQKAVKIICSEIVDQRYKTWYDKAEAAWKSLMKAEKRN